MSQGLLRQNGFLFYKRAKPARKDLKWESGIDQRMFYLELNLFSGEAVKEGQFASSRLRTGQSARAWGKERIVTKVWLTSILF